MPATDGAAAPDRRLLRWFAASAGYAVPQAAAPIAFALLALELTGDAGQGAALVLAMTLAQVLGAIPVARLGQRLPAVLYLKLLVGLRSLALAAVAALAALEAPFAGLVAAAALAGSVSGAAHGYLRAVLNQLAPAGRLPRALAIAGTLNELTFVIAPVAASGLGSLSPVVAVLALTALGAAPILLVPGLRQAVQPADPASGGGRLPGRAILPWLFCAMAGGATVAAIEIGAVALALRFGHAPELAFLFTVPLCLAAVAGGVWASWRARLAARRVVAAQLGLMTLGAALVALQLSVEASMAGAVAVGLVLTPLGTHYSLMLDRLAPPQRRAEVFALLRTANAVGVILASALLTAVSLSVMLAAVTALMLLAALAVGLGRDGAPPPHSAKR
ncbi:MFS transporter [Roseomonas sp. USHLN139]|uniref:MFS transporter n=1 Tax=Roseomonas sp. USHLN139 TaxID=3081298 RepID=UPI003B01AA12